MYFRHKDLLAQRKLPSCNLPKQFYADQQVAYLTSQHCLIRSNLRTGQLPVSHATRVEMHGEVRGSLSRHIETKAAGRP